MTECICCGDCCDPVVLNRTRAEFQRMNPGDDATREDRDFILTYMRQLPLKEGLSRATHYNGKLDRLAREHVETGDIDALGDKTVFYECEFFDNDPTSRTYRMCTAHDLRPPLCRKFPDGHGDWPNPRKFLPIDCSYRIDLIRKEDRHA